MMGFKFFSQRAEGLSVVVNPATLSTTGPNGPLTSGLATATPAGGTPPYTYLWSRVSGDVFTINGPTGPNVTFTSVGNDVAFSGVYKCVVTDDNSDTVQDTVTVNFQHGTPM